MSDAKGQLDSSRSALDVPEREAKRGTMCGDTTCVARGGNFPKAEPRHEDKGRWLTVPASLSRFAIQRKAKPQQSGIGGAQASAMSLLTFLGV